MNWNRQDIHQHNRTAQNYPGFGIGSHEYCRNPDGEPTIWCYTVDPKMRWEVCDPLKVVARQILLEDGTCKDCEHFTKPLEGGIACGTNKCSQRERLMKDGTCLACGLYTKVSNDRKECIPEECDKAQR